MFLKALFKKIIWIQFLCLWHALRFQELLEVDQPDGSL